MTDRPLFIVLTGPSGSGKSTAMAGVRQKLKFSHPVVFPLRVTTRPRRVSDNPEEVFCIAEKQFHQGVVAGKILIVHKIREKWNGLVFANDFKHNNTLYMQALPTSAAVAVKDQHSHHFNVIICRLKATKHTVLERLSQRGPKDDAPADEAAKRAQLTPAGNDIEIDAERNADAVQNSIIQIIKTCHSTPEHRWREVIECLPMIKYVDSPAGSSIGTLAIMNITPPKEERSL